ncbi:MAG: heme NO-binding domain-containing protein, partial [Verrucomicrobiota bacterium]
IMKGVVFTEFFEMVEESFGLDMVDDLIDACDLPSGGEYTAVGTYDHEEMVALVLALSEKTETPVPDLLQAFGEYLFGRFTALYPRFFEDGPKDALGFLEVIESHIHKEVRKLYPNAKLPHFDTERLTDDQLIMVYRSERHLQDLAEGLIRGCFKHFGEGVQLERNDDDASGGVRFELTSIREACLKIK